jgi:hypothetical protein
MRKKNEKKTNKIIVNKQTKNIYIYILKFLYFTKHQVKYLDLAYIYI